MTRHQKIVSFKLSHVMGLIADLKREETPKSCMFVKLDNLEEHVGRVLDCYRLEHFDTADLNKASRIIDVMNDAIYQEYPPLEAA